MLQNGGESNINLYEKYLQGLTQSASPTSHEASAVKLNTMSNTSLNAKVKHFTKPGFGTNQKLN